jgi:integrase
MAAAHLDIKTLQTIAGHSDISTTMNRYAHGREDKIIQAGGLLKNMYG